MSNFLDPLIDDERAQALVRRIADAAYAEPATNGEMLAALGGVMSEVLRPFPDVIRLDVLESWIAMLRHIVREQMQ